MHGGSEGTGPSKKMQNCNTQMCHWATGNNLFFLNPDRDPVLCGGDTGFGKCMKYQASSGNWEEIGSVLHDKPMRAWDYNPDVGLVIAGGMWQAKAEISRDHGVTFEALPDVRHPDHYIAYACLAIEGNAAFHIGGYIGRRRIREVYELEIGVDTEWKEAPPLNWGRNDHTCRSFTDSAGERGILVVGGHNHDHQMTDSIEIFSLKDREWRHANPFPIKTYQHAMARYQDSFIAGGGTAGQRMWRYHVHN